MLAPQTMLQNGRYQIVQPIGQGGMGAVYEAYDHRLKKRIAIKEALVGGTTLHQAFEREAQRLANLSHPSLPNVIDHFWEDKGHYLVMDLIEGQDLGEMLEQRGQAFGQEDVYRWAEQLLETLVYLHRKGIVHRDIKPANIKLTPEGRLILLDFGLAKGGPTHKTITGRSLLGYSLGFAPPEQMVGVATDARSDLYSLGATLYALITGQIPVDARLRIQAQQHNLPDPLRPANEINWQVPQAISHFLSQVMALDLEHRPDSAQTMLAILQNARSGSSFSQGHPSSPPRHSSHAQPPSSPQNFSPASSHPSHSSHAQPPSSPQNFRPASYHPSDSSHAQPPSTPQNFGPTQPPSTTSTKPNRNQQLIMALIALLSLCLFAICGVIAATTLPLSEFMAILIPDTSPTETVTIESSPTVDQIEPSPAAIPPTEPPPAAQTPTESAAALSERAQFYYEQGFAEYKKDQNDEAIIHFDQALELEPSYSKAWAGRGLAYQHKGDYNQAFSDCNKAIELEPDLADGYYCRGYTSQEEGEYEQALTDLSKALELNYEIIAWVYHFRARTYNSIGNRELKDADYRQAIEAYKQLIAENPKDATFYSYIGFAYGDTEEYELAIENYDEAIRLYPGFANAYLGRGSVYESQENYEKAFNDFSKAIELNHQPPGWAFTGRGFVRIQQGDYEEAISDFSQSIQENTNYDNAYSGRGWAYALQGQFEPAIEDCQQAIRLKAKSFVPHFWCAIVYNLQGDDEQAIAKFSDAINLKADFAVAYNLRGQVYARQGNSAQALQDSDKAVSLEPDDPYVYRDRGDLFSLLENYEQAIENYNRAIELRADFAQVYSSRAWVYYQKGSSNYDEALADCQKAIELDPEDGYHYNICGIIYYSQENYALAINYFSDAIQRSPEDAVLYNNRGDAYQFLGDTDNAIADYRQAFALGDDSSERAKERLQELGVEP